MGRTKVHLNDYTRALGRCEVSIQKQNDGYGSPAQSLGLLLPTGFGGEPNQKKSELLGNEASLNFVSHRSLFDCVGRLRLSRVKMNALWAPLTSLTVRRRRTCVFRLADVCVFFVFLLLFPRQLEMTISETSKGKIYYFFFCHLPFFCFH